MSNIFTSEQVASWLIYEAKKYRTARTEYNVTKDELDVILGAEHALFKMSKQLFVNVGKDFVEMLKERKFAEDAAKAINLVIGKVEKTENFVNCEADVMGLVCKETAEQFFMSMSCDKKLAPYKMGACVALAAFVDDLAFQLEFDPLGYLESHNIPIDVVYKILGYKS